MGQFLNSQQEQDPSHDSLAEEHRAVNQSFPQINFSNPLVFNPNLTPTPAQPVLIADIHSLLVYISGAQESGPFGNTTTTNQQINSINNANLQVPAYKNNQNTNQITAPNNSAFSQNDQSQKLALAAVGIAATTINGTAFGTVQTSNQLSQQAAFASATNNASQAATNIKPNETAAGAINNPSVTIPISNNISGNSQQTSQPQSTIANPNPFVTLNDPTPRPRIVTWTDPLIIDDNNQFFNTESVVKFQENIVFKPARNYQYPIAYVDYHAAIIIAKDNITIDLAGFNLSLDPSSSSGFLSNNPIYGISILPGVKNIKIISSGPHDKKGSISGFCGFAIYGDGNFPSYNFDIYGGMIISLTIDNILMVYNSGGISITNALEVTINNVNIVYNFGARIVYGIYFNNVLNGSITNTKSNQSYSYVDVIGIYLLDTIGIFIDNCSSSFNRSLQNGISIGMEITGTIEDNSHDNTISNSIASGNLCSYVTAKESIGILINSHTKNNNINNCTTSYNSHGPSFGGATDPVVAPIAYGIKLHNTRDNQVSKNQSAYNDNFGFFDNAVASTSFFSSNTALFNETSYQVNIQLPGPTIGPLPTIILYQYNLATYTGTTSPLMNIEVKNVY